MGKKLGKLIAFMVLAMGILSACSGDTAGDGNKGGNEGKTKDTFIYGIDGDPGNSVNVITTNDRYGLTVMKTVYSPLYKYNGPDDLTYYLAESIEPSEDFLTYTAKLRKDVKWHDGEAFTADDVIFTFEQMLDEKNGGSAYGQLQFNGKPLTVEKVDDHTVVFTLPSVSMSATEALSSVFIMPEHIYKGETNIANSKKNAAPVGTGPYKLKEYKAGESVSFESNEDYFLGKPEIKNVVYRIIPDANTATVALQKGEIDALAISPADVAKFKGNENISIKPYDEDRVGYMAFNLSSENTPDKEIRKALLTALNKEEIIQASYLSDEYAQPAYSILPKRAAYHTEDVEKYEYDSDAAGEALKGQKLKLRLAYVSNNAFMQKQAAVIQQNWKAVGVDVELVGMDATAMYNKLAEKHSDFELFLNGYIMGNDPDQYKSLYVSDSFSNYSHYANPKVDELFNKGQVETDSAARQQIYQEVQQIIADDAFFYPITENKRILAINSNIEVPEDNLVAIYTFEDLSKLSIK